MTSASLSRVRADALEMQARVCPVGHVPIFLHSKSDKHPTVGGNLYNMHFRMQVRPNTHPFRSFSDHSSFTLLGASSCNKYYCWRHCQSPESSVLQLTGFLHSEEGWAKITDVNASLYLLKMIITCINCKCPHCGTNKGISFLILLQKYHVSKAACSHRVKKNCCVSVLQWRHA